MKASSEEGISLTRQRKTKRRDDASASTAVLVRLFYTVQVANGVECTLHIAGAVE